MPEKTKAEPLGSYLYYFKSTVGGDNCLISAHGGYFKNTSMFSLNAIAQGINVCFYGEHHKTLSDPGLDLLSKRPKTVNEHPKDGDMVLDYVLSKYQGKHSKANETYAAIEQKLKNDATRKQAYEDNWDYVLGNPEIKRIYDSLASCNVVTIRNRWNKSDVSLKYVISTVHQHHPEIKNFHCSFCRSLVGDPNPESSVVTSRS